MAKKHRQPSAPQDVYVDLLLMPGTRVLFWAVGECPFCGAKHYHAAGTERDDPGERLGEVQSGCGGGAYILAAGGTGGAGVEKAGDAAHTDQLPRAASSRSYSPWYAPTIVDMLNRASTWARPARPSSALRSGLRARRTSA